MLILVAGTGVFLLSEGCKKREPVLIEAGKGKAIYQCSMHPTIVSEKPDDCPICGMRLTLVEQVPDAVAPAIPTGERKIVFYRHPMQPDVISPTPAKDEMGMDYVAVYEDEVPSAAELPVPGHAEVFISPEKQQLIGVETALVEEIPLALTIRAVGRVAFDPELYNTFAEYKEALAAQENVKGSPLSEVRERAEALVRSAVLKLRLLGVNETQMEEFLKANSGVSSLLLPTDTVWVYASIYEYEADLVKAGQSAAITSPALPRMRFTGTVRSVDPILNAMSRTLRVRIEAPNTSRALKPEMFVDVGIEVSLGEKLAVPVDALFDAGETQLVFVDKGKGHIEPRQVEVGYEARGYYEVLSGLSKGEKVVSSANFLIDSESRLRAAVAGFGGVKKEHQNTRTPEHQ